MVGSRWLVGLVLVLGACSGDDDECPPAPETTLQVTVRDASTGDPICDAVVTVQFGTESEELVACPYTARYRGWGAYDVKAEKSGYASNTVTILTAEDEECPTGDPLRVNVNLTRE